MNIGIIARDLSKRGGGTKTYLTGLLMAIDRVVADTDTVFVYHNAVDQRHSFARIKSVYIPISNRLLFDYVAIPVLTHLHRLDTLLCTKYAIPFFARGRRIVIMYDLGYFEHEAHIYPFTQRAYMRTVIRRAAKAADAFITLSQQVKSELERFVGVVARRIHVIPPGIDRSAFRALAMNDPAVLRARRTYGLPERFILCVSDFVPRKNLARLLRAYVQRDSVHRDVALVLVGSAGWNSKVSVARSIRTPGVILTGFVPENDLAALYSSATVFCYPSLYEGFGLPIIEAQSCGCPVIASNTTSCPESGGDGACYIDPFDEQAMLVSINKMLGDGMLRTSYVLRGFRNVERFRWEECAQQTLELCRRITGTTTS